MSFRKSKKIRRSFWKQRITQFGPIVIFMAVMTLIIAVSVTYAIYMFLDNRSKASVSNLNLAVPAFPGAEGFGSTTPGGRGGKVYEVTNLNDSGPGSLRNCIDAVGITATQDSDYKRICVFRVGGIIKLNSNLRVYKPYLTIAGQTAPGGGITLRSNTSTTHDPLDIKTHDVVVRYITSRPGPIAYSADAIAVSEDNDGFNPTYNVILDHVSMSWSVDQTFATWYDVKDFTLQWSMMYDPLHYSIHDKNMSHGYGPMLGSYGDSVSSGLGAQNISFHHNFTAHTTERSPMIKTSGVVDVVNNYDYNIKGKFSHVDVADQRATIPVNYVNNYAKAGPNSDSDFAGIKVANLSYSSYAGTKAQIYQAGNVLVRRTGTIISGDAFLDVSAQPYKWPTRHEAPTVTTYTAQETIDQVLARSGNYQGIDEYGNWYFRRDAIDKRVVEEAKRGEGRFIDAPSEALCVGLCATHRVFLTPADYTKYGITDTIAADGYPVLASGTPPVDQDHDGMPDTFEVKYGFGILNPADRNDDPDHDVYTNVEEYFNGTNPLVPDGSVVPTPTPTPLVTPTPRPSPSPSTTPRPSPSPTPGVTGVLSVKITSPVNGATVSSTVNVWTSVTDNVGTTTVKFYVDGKYVTYDNTAPDYDEPINFSKLRKGTHVLKVTAADASGKTAEHSITVYKP